MMAKQIQSTPLSQMGETRRGYTMAADAIGLKKDSKYHPPLLKFIKNRTLQGIGLTQEAEKMIGAKGQRTLHFTAAIMMIHTPRTPISEEKLIEMMMKKKFENIPRKIKEEILVPLREQGIIVTSKWKGKSVLAVHPDFLRKQVN